MRFTRILAAVAVVVCTGATALLAQKTVTPPRRVGGVPAPAATPAQSAAPSRAAAPKTDAKPAPAANTREQDEKAIRQLAVDFAKAYNAADAKAIAALFTTDAESADEAGNVVQGRIKIEAMFAQVLAENPGSQMALEVQSIRFVAPNTAIEDGTATISGAADEPDEATRYTVVHVKQDGGWLMASVRDLHDEPITAREALEPLAWMVGDWIDESSDALVVRSTEWSDSEQFLLTKFTMQIAGRAVMHGTQRIGWDPVAKVIRTWVFDSEGGFAEGLYVRHGADQWITKMTGINRDGQVATSTNVTTVVNNDQMVWESRDRTIGDGTSPNIDPVTIVRKPPKAN